MQALLPILNNPKLPYIRFRNPNENTKDIRQIVLKLPDVRRDPFLVTKYFYEIWDVILSQSKSHGMLDGGDADDGYTRSFKAMMFFIQKEYRSQLSLQDIADSGSVSKSLCNRIFHKYVGMSPVNYLLNFRVRKVAEYLRTTTLSLSEIAQKSGFNGTSYMSEMFKKSFGRSPRDYRKSPENWN